ncbi:hypothetical protein [Clostridium saccharoperbutylacetonicum]|uniref:hypothetical protein n=1 Tax=Clostridium saccharoperbutylacetonicum TaxID=36745 RepID=UPI0039E89324
MINKLDDMESVCNDMQEICKSISNNTHRYINTQVKMEVARKLYKDGESNE